MGADARSAQLLAHRIFLPYELAESQVNSDQYIKKTSGHLKFLNMFFLISRSFAVFCDFCDAFHPVVDSLVFVLFLSHDINIVESIESLFAKAKGLSED